MTRVKNISSFVMTQVKGYKLYNPNKGKIIISRDVKFNEDEAWD